MTSELTRRDVDGMIAGLFAASAVAFPVAFSVSGRDLDQLADMHVTHNPHMNITSIDAPSYKSLTVGNFS